MTWLIMPDTPEGRAVEQIVASLTDGAEPGQLARVRKLSRIGFNAMVALVGPDEAASFFIRLSNDALRLRGCGKGRKRA